MPTQDDFDCIGQAEEEAKQSGGKFNFGKLSIKPRFLRWNGKGEKPSEITAQQYAQLAAGQRGMEYVFGVDIKEFQPAINFTYERRVSVGGLDWVKIFKPSLEALAGGRALVGEDLANALRSLNGKYVAMEDVPQAGKPKDPDKVFSTPKMHAMYQTRAECYAAYVARYGDPASRGNGHSGNGHSGNGQAGAPAFDPNVPPIYKPDVWYGMKADLQKLVDRFVGGGLPQVAALAKAAAEYGAEAKHVAALLGLGQPEGAPAVDSENVAF